MLFVGTSIIHPSTEGVFLLCNILDLLIYSNKYVSTLDATTWNGSNLKFYNTRTNKPGSDDRQSMANTFTSITFDAVNKILQSNVNLTLKSLGFTRYNG